jgi:hypothetical protein
VVRGVPIVVGVRGNGLSRAENPDIVKSSGASSDPSGGGGEPPTLASFFHRGMLVGVVGVVLVVGSLAVASRSEAEAIVPPLIGVRVDPQLDTLRLRLEAADLALGDVTVGRAPSSTSPEQRSSSSRGRSSGSTRAGERASPRPPPST